MKRVFYCLILTAAASFVLSSCGDAQTTMLNQYRLHINFKDAAGNDLVASLGEEYYISESWRTKWVNEINPDKYSLDIILSDGVNATKPYYTLAKYNDNHSWLIPEVNGRYDGDGT